MNFKQNWFEYIVMGTLLALSLMLSISVGFAIWLNATQLWQQILLSLVVVAFQVIIIVVIVLGIKERIERKC